MFQIIVFSTFLIKHMDYHIPIIKKNPRSLSATLNAAGGDAHFFFDLFFYIGYERLDLSVIFARGDYKVINQIIQWSKMKNRYFVLTLSIGSDRGIPNNAYGDFFRFSVMDNAAQNTSFITCNLTSTFIQMWFK